MIYKKKAFVHVKIWKLINKRDECADAHFFCRYLRVSTTENLSDLNLGEPCSAAWGKFVLLARLLCISHLLTHTVTCWTDTNDEWGYVLAFFFFFFLNPVFVFPLILILCWPCLSHLFHIIQRSVIQCLPRHSASSAISVSWFSRRSLRMDLCVWRPVRAVSPVLSVLYVLELCWLHWKIMYLSHLSPQLKDWSFWKWIPASAPATRPDNPP